MKKRDNKKNIVRAAIDMIIMGCITIGIGIGFSSSSSKDTRVITELTEHLYEAENIEKIDSIEVNLASEEIIIKEAKDNKLTVEYWDNIDESIYKIETDGNELNVSRSFVKPKKIKGFRIIDIAKSVSKSDSVVKTDAPVVISVPKSYKGKIDVNSFSGNIAVSNLKLDSKIDLATTSGRIAVKNVMTKDLLDVTSVSGSIVVEDSMCEVLMGSNVSGIVSLKDAKVNRKLIVEAVSGEIDVNIDGRSSDYKVLTDTMSGRMKVDKDTNDSADRLIKAETKSGNINISFNE